MRRELPSACVIRAEAAAASGRKTAFRVITQARAAGGAA